MHISKISLVNYRNFSNAKFLFSKGINTIIGENGSGKTNLFRAIRLLLDNSLSRSSMRLNENDFCRKLSDFRGHWIIISVEFEDISTDEISQSLVIHSIGNIEEDVIEKATCNLIFRPKAHIRQQLGELLEGNVEGLKEVLEKIKIEDYEMVCTGKSDSDFNSPEVYLKIVGDFDKVVFPKEINSLEVGVIAPRILSLPDEVSFTYVKALRDVVSDFHNNRTNPLFSLLKYKSGEVNTENFEPIATLVNSLNDSIESFPDIIDIKNDIKRTIDDAVGDTYSPHSISVKSALSDEAEQLFRALRLFVDESGDGYEGTISELSLGGANLIYLTLKLLEFEYQRENQYVANFILIEEPEAHIHNHIQKTIFEKIKPINTQIIYSTHSSNISEVSNISNVNIIGKVNGYCESFQPSKGLTDPQIGFVQRYLDAIRSNLLFAKSVILVEGDAEEILIPVLIKKSLGVSLDELGITLVNMRSTGFENIALLFHDERIKKKCSIITDLDATFFDVTERDDDIESDVKRKNKAVGSQKTGADRKIALDLLCANNTWIEPFYAKHTFEVDFIESGNRSYIENIIEDVYVDPKTIENCREAILANEISIYGQKVLTMANYKGKGWFAISLAKEIDCYVTVPEYIMDAVFFSHGNFDDKTILKIIKYRLKNIQNYVNQNRKFSDPKVNSKNYVEWDRYLTKIEESLASFNQEVMAFEMNDCDHDISVNKLKVNMATNVVFHVSNDFLLKM